MLFIETSESTKQLPAHLDDNGYAALQTFLSARPDAGDIIRGSGGIRRKGVKDDLSPAERASWRKVVEEIKHG